MGGPSSPIHPTPLRRAARPTRRAAPFSGATPLRPVALIPTQRASLGRLRAHLERFPSKRRRSLHRRRSLFTGYGVVQQERSASSLHDRLIEQLAIECHGAEALQSCPFKRVDHASCVRNLLGAWAERFIDRVDLPWMDQRLSAETEAAR